jgi:hypothetical protein
MARSLDITVPPDTTDQLLDELRTVEGVLSLRVQRGISLQPPGDVVSIDATSPAIHEIMRRLDRRGLASQSGVSIATSDRLSLLSPASMNQIVTDDTEATWEEMEMSIAKESNMTVNGLAVMAIAGMVAAWGVASNALHLVIGAMVIAPGFEPITRIALGVVARRRAWRHGVIDTLKGYAVLIAAAAAAALLLRAMGKSPLPGEASYFPPGTLLNYWTTITATSLLVSTAASIAGAVLIASHRAVLTAGVMITLALVPSAAILGMSLAETDLHAARQSATRLLIEIALVLSCSLLVFLWKRLHIQRRDLAGQE